MVQHKHFKRYVFVGLATILVFVAAGLLRVQTASGDRLGARSLQLSDSTPGMQANYKLSFTGQTSGTVGSIRLQFCSNDPLIGTPCTAPTGFDVSSAVLASQSGMTGFSIDAVDTTTNVLVLGRVPGPAIAGNSTYELTGVINPSSEGSYYVRLETFATNNASGSDHDYGGIAFATGTPVHISTYVPPYLLFCTGITIKPYDCSTASGNYINFGNISPNKTSTGTAQVLIATNGDSGYNMRVVGTTLTSGNNTIPALTSGSTAQIGTSQFGLNFAGNSAPSVGSSVQGPGTGTVNNGYGVANLFKFNSGDIVAGAPQADSYRLYTASYMVNISKDQAPGVYVSTITYVTLANF